MHNGRPIGTRTRIRLLVALTILAWATQTLLQQWGYGQAVPTPAVRFVPHEAGSHGGTLELRAEATVIGSEVSLKQICRWSETDRNAFAPIENLVLLRLSTSSPYRTITLDEIKSTLHDAGVNLGRIRFVGATQCIVSRRDVTFDEGEALRQWVAAKEAANDAVPAAATSEAADVAAPSQPAERPEPAPRADIRPIITEQDLGTPIAGAAPSRPAAERPVHRRLRDVLVDTLAQAAGVPAEALVVDFKPQDDHLLNLAEPHFRFHATVKRGKIMGPAAWDVTIDADGEMRKAQISATARCWQQQLVVARPIAHRQVLRDDDVVERRTLVDQLGVAPLVSRRHAIGQMAAMELRPGTVLNARMIEAVPLVRSGQLVSVTLRQGSVQIRSVARALEGGTYGQTIRVRNESTRDIYDVTVTGPQEAVLGESATAVATLSD